MFLVSIRLNMPYNMKRNKFHYLVLTAVLSAILLSCNGGDRYVTESGMIWNTSFHITFRGPVALRDSVLRVLDEVGRSLSVFDPKSLVSIVNASDSVAVDDHFQRVWHTSVKVNKESSGYFDPTLSPLITAWGFGPGHKATADTLRIDSIRKFVGITRSEISSGVIFKSDPRMQFNFSAVAKGYGCDVVGEMFRRNGVEDYLVEIGGEICAHGNSPRGDNWNISIDRPVLSADSAIHDSQGVISLTDRGVATSGNYRNFHAEGGKRYGHTISPQTGRPVQTDVISATVVAPTCMEADAYATACMAMGSAQARQMTERLRLPAMFVLADSTVWMSDSFKKLVKE